MTTIAEFKQMLQQEINEPLDYPRVPGTSREELREYNEGYHVTCEVALAGSGRHEVAWVRDAIGFFERYHDTYTGGNPYQDGRHDAYNWILGELKSIESDAEGDTITIPRARYNYLLELERNATQFTESFTRWER